MPTTSAGLRKAGVRACIPDTVTAVDPASVDQLRAIVDRYGVEITADSRRLKALLVDLMPERRREMAVLIAAVEENIPTDLVTRAATEPADAVSSQLVQRLIEHRALSPDAASWSVSTWAAAMRVALPGVTRRRSSSGVGAEKTIDLVSDPDEEALDDYLRDLLRDPDRLEYVIVRGSRGYVQFTLAGNGAIRAEAPSNAFLDPEDRLTEAEQAAIVHLGWSDDGPKANYRRLFESPVSISDAADLAEATIGAYGDDFNSSWVDTAIGTIREHEIQPPAAGEVGTAATDPAFGFSDELALEDHLANLLSDPARFRFIVLEGPRGYVQFAPFAGGALYGEAASNWSLNGARRLSDAEGQQMLALGWDPPMANANYRRVWPQPVDVEWVADIAERTLAVYGDDFAAATVRTGE